MSIIVKHSTGDSACWEGAPNQILLRAPKRLGPALKPALKPWYRQKVIQSLRTWCHQAGMSQDQANSLKVMICKNDGISHRLYEIEFDGITPSIYCTDFVSKMDRFGVRDFVDKLKPRKPRVRLNKFRRIKEAHLMPRGGVMSSHEAPPESGISFTSPIPQTRRQRRKGHNKKPVPKTAADEILGLLEHMTVQ